MTGQSALALIDELLRGWPSFDAHEDYYRSTAIPELMRGESKFPPERRIAASLRELLRPEEWEQLPDLIDQRRAGNLQGIASDLEREAAAREEARRRKAIAREEDSRRALIEAEQERRREHAAREEAERVAAQEAAERDRERRTVELLQRIETSFEQEFLSAAQRFSAEPHADLVGDQRFEDLRTEYVSRWALRELGEKFGLDDEQAAAVAAVDGDVQVVARAGSGKTRTLTARAAFLQRHGGCRPGSILCLAFNRAAAEEMKERLAEAVGDTPHVMTFHALAYALVHPQEDLKLMTARLPSSD